MEFNQTSLAREWLTKALASKSDRYSLGSALAQAEINILLQEKNPHEAIDILWKLYQTTPIPELLKQIANLASSLTPVKNWQEEAVEFHRRQLNNKVQAYDELMHANRLIALLLQQKKYEDALVVCNEHLVDTHLLLQLADYFSDQPGKSVPLVSRVIHAILGRSNVNNQDYQKVVALLKQIRSYANTGKAPDMFTKFLTVVRASYRAKRNLIAYIQEAFGS